MSCGTANTPVEDLPKLKRGDPTEADYLRYLFKIETGGKYDQVKIVGPLPCWILFLESDSQGRLC
jgi:hypothetical protein